VDKKGGSYIGGLKLTGHHISGGFLKKGIA